MKTVFKSILIILCIILAAIHIHQFFGYTRNAPYVTIDDTIANVSFALVTHGRYGELTTPIMAPVYTIRTWGFYNYGPFYFYIGAFLCWLFGNSITIMRFLHPLGLISIVGMSFWVFRKSSIAAGGILAVVLSVIFTLRHWPMVRPDIMISVFCGLTFLFSYYGFTVNSWKAWMGAAFSTIGAFTTHQISFGLIPALGLVFGIWVFNTIKTEGWTERSKKIVFTCFSGLILGGIISTLVYFIAIEFRIKDLLSFFSAYSSFVQKEMSYGEILESHIIWTWGGLNSYFYSVMLIYLVSTILVILSFRMGNEKRTSILALVLPPTAFGLSYLFSLGFYSNFHLGYTILSHTLAAWTFASLFAAAGALGSIYYPQKWYFVEIAAIIIVSLLVLNRIQNVMAKPSSWALKAQEWVAFDDYADQTLRLLPDGATAWGEMVFGLDSGKRVNVVEFHNATTMTQGIDREKLKELVPDFLLIGTSLLKDILIFEVRNAPPLMQNFLFIFPEERYSLVGLVHAPPYGTTRIYQHKSSETETPSTPFVAVNHGYSSQWSYQLSDPLPVDFKPCDPVTMTISYGGQILTKTCDRSVKTELPEGTYLIRARVENRHTLYTGILIGTSTSDYKNEVTDMGVGIWPGLYFPYESEVFMIAEHMGGEFYVSQIDRNPEATFTIETIIPVVSLQKEYDTLSIPPFSQWLLSTRSEEAQILAATDSVLTVSGDESQWGYQIKSPPIQIPQKSFLKLVIPIKVDQGQIRVGILDQNESWLIYPQIHNNPFYINTGNNNHITIVVQNYQIQEPFVSSKFTVFKPQLLTVIDRENLYVDDLISEYLKLRNK
ncbi:hypothetical protein LLG96_18885 [bacterium]|nr:hypothetical protein [bacterium]